MLLNNIQETKIETVFDMAVEISRLLDIPTPLYTQSGLTVDDSKASLDLKKYRDFLVWATLKNEIDPRDDKRMFKGFLQFYNLYVTFDVEKYITEDDIVEAYGEDFVQLYRNRVFFKFCSYDIYTILSHPFHVLYRRDEKDTARIIDRAVHCMTQQKTISKFDVPAHYLQEHYAKNDKVFEVTEKWCAPMYSTVTNKVMGIFCSKKAQLIGSSNVTGIGFVSTPRKDIGPDSLPTN